MLITVPDYYNEFQCIAGECEDTCCAGWQIVIDEASKEKYKNISGNFGKRLERQIDWREGVFRQSKDKACVFLNDENLCDIYRVLGEQALCKTCRNYPRHTEEFEDVREISLSVSCPEVARILLSKMEKVTFLESEDGKEETEDYEDFDFLLYSVLVDARKVMIEIAQDRTMEIKQRMVLLLGIAHDLEKRFRDGELFSYQEVLDKYEGESARRYAQSCVLKWKKRKRKVYQFSEKMFGKLYGMERLKGDWERVLRESYHDLYASGYRGYSKKECAFLSWIRENEFPWNIQAEQLLVYFISTYFCGAVYDGNILAKVQMAVVHVWMIRELLLVQWIRNERELCLEDVVEVVYRYSREAEHSDENLNWAEKEFRFRMNEK